MSIKNNINSSTYAKENNKRKPSNIANVTPHKNIDTLFSVIEPELNNNSIIKSFLKLKKLILNNLIINLLLNIIYKIVFKYAIKKQIVKTNNLFIINAKL